MNLTDEKIRSRILEMLEERWSQLSSRDSVKPSEVDLVDRNKFVVDLISEFNLSASENPELLDRVAKVWKGIMSSKKHFRLVSGGFLLPRS